MDMPLITLSPWSGGNFEEGNTVKVKGLFPVVTALTGNLFITCIKFVGFLLSRSPSLFSEAVHSFADFSNQTLLLIGIRRSSKKADAEFDYGYGQERFFWNLVSACGVFFIGAGVTISHGIESVRSGHPGNIDTATFVILAVSLVIEVFSFYTAFRELKHSCQGKGFGAMMKGGDPSTLAVLLEDGVAVIGVVIACAAIFLTYLTGSYVWDAIGSIIIGVLLGIVAIILINMNRKYLIEKAIPEEEKERVMKTLNAEPSIVCVKKFKSTTLGVDRYRIKCEIRLNEKELMEEVRKDGYLEKQYEEIKKDYNRFISFCYDFSRLLTRLVGRRIDRIEKAVQNEAPHIKHVDIEID
jgi:zinc transporter 9